MAEKRLPHITLIKPPETTLYTTTVPGRSSELANPVRDREHHGRLILGQLKRAWDQAEQERVVSHATRNGVYLEFRGDADFELATQSLEDLSKKIRLLNVRKLSEISADEETGAPTEKITTFATVYVPNKEKKFFLNKLEKYLHENTLTNKPKNGPLVESIADVRKALLVDSFWCESSDLIPAQQQEWIEVWLSSHSTDVIRGFETLLIEHKIQSRSGVIKFPERAIKVIFADHKELEKLSLLSDHIAEYRRAKAPAVYLMDRNNNEQAVLVEKLRRRIRVNSESNSVVCILDTGVNNGHPLIQPVLSDQDCQAFDLDWGTDDHDKHGTLMAGIVAYGDVTKALLSDGDIDLLHRLESVKILPKPPEQNAPNLWGYITSQAVNRAEIQAPGRNRCICMAITASDTRDRGKPSSWSAELDQLASGSQDENGVRRLIIVSAGNTTANTNDAAKQYPAIQLTDSVHDPAQSWNALTVGAYTALDSISDPLLAGYSPVAPKDCISPFTTTSLDWEENKWPIKPELVLEGGNLAVDGTGFVSEADELSLLSTFYKPHEGHFYPFNMTSAATAQLGWMAGQLQAQNPSFWPETVRGLLVHSAEWPEAMKKQFINKESKTDFKRLLSICGYGVPNLERALYSAQHSLTLIAQAELQPFDKKPKGESGYRTRDMHLYELPWPKDVLLALPDATTVQMRITLSYFVEPGPGEIGWKDRYRYASHALRFDLNSPGETKNEFVRRINKAAWSLDESKPDTQSPSDHWVFGSQARNRGSVHSDIWRGTAAQLAGSNLIAISPTIGWWRERSYLGRWRKQTRYSLVVSITTSDVEVDIYTPIALQVGIPIEINI